MSGYIVEEPESVPTFYNEITKEETVECWRLYSNIQRKRFQKVLKQLKDTWYDVYNTIKIINTSSYINVDKDIMPKIYNMFMINHKDKTDYYNEEKIRLRKQKGYISKKIKKLKNTKQKI